VESVLSALFAFFATAVADHVDGRRPGARHAMLVFVDAPDFEAGQRKAGGVMIGAGWMLARLEKGKELNSADPQSDPVLAEAQAHALETGSAIVVYADELPPDA
jgi:hypothetical protein